MRTSQQAVRLSTVLLFASLSSTAIVSAQTGQLKIDPLVLNFGAHDIGTTSPLTLTVTNNGSASATPEIALAGDDSGEFTWNGTCLSKVPSGGKCTVTVYFAPLKITKDEKREARLVISIEKGESQTVQLAGSAFQNLGASPAHVRFEDQVVDTAASPQTVVVTNYSDATVPTIAVSATGDFTETHSKCEKLAPGAACAISVVFQPKTDGVASGSLAISSDRSNLNKQTRLVLLEGRGLVRCKLPALSLRSSSLWLVLLVSGLYFTGLVLVRWHMIAKPARAQLVTQIQSVRANLKAETGGAALPPADMERIANINRLLDWAVYPLKNEDFPVERNPDGSERSYYPGWFPRHTRLYNAIFWPRGQELAGWSCSHEAELLLVQLLPIPQVTARLETAEQQLRALSSAPATALADLLHAATTAAPPAPPDRLRALLAQALSALYEQGDKNYFELATWHSKMMWLVGSALLLIFALAVTLQNAVLLLLGSVGGLLSRLARTVNSADKGNDYGATWGALFLSPLSGALSAWGGILLIAMGRKLNLFGPAMNVDWCNPYEPATLAMALLFGFSERLFDGVASQIQEKIAKIQAPTAAPPTQPAGAKQD